MAKRTLRPKHQEEIKAKIRASQLLNLVQRYALKGEVGWGAAKSPLMEPKRIDAAIALLRKVLPDLASTEAKITNVSYLEALRDLRVGDPEAQTPVVHSNTEDEQPPTLQ